MAGRHTMKQGQVAQGQQGATAEGQSGVIASIAAKVVADADARASGQGNIDEQTEQKELTVDVGGVQRSVKMDELVSAFNERERVAEAKRALDTRLAELGDLNSIRRLSEQIGSLDSARRMKVLAILEGKVSEDDESVEDAVAGEAYGRKPAPQSERDSEQTGLPRGMAEKFGILEKAVMALAQREHGRMQVEVKASLESQVDKEMAQYPLFKGNKVASSLAKDSIMAMLASDQSATPDKVVRSAAGRLQELLNARGQEVNEQLGVPRTMVQEADKKFLNAQGLKSGAIRHLAERMMAGRSPQT